MKLLYLALERLERQARSLLERQIGYPSLNVHCPCHWFGQYHDPRQTSGLVCAANVTRYSVAIEIGKEGPRVTDRNHGRRNLRRAFVAESLLPARLPARSALIE